MIECLIVGDSIAVGLKSVRPECFEMARVGITSPQWVRVYGDRPALEGEARTVIISLGSNDSSVEATSVALNTIRTRVRASRVIWIMPAIKPYIQKVVEALAASHGDGLVYIRGLSHDGVHPTGIGYRNMASDTRR